ncbi:TPA: hypothetical protein U8251_001684 [Pseudomonas putida]|nr:hypothetical protein [Pseudomonas putida]
MVVVFFVTSADSGALVVDNILDQYERHLHYLHVVC